MEKTMHAFTAALVFLSMATLTKHRILRYESYFFIFRVFVFLIKKHRKNDLKMQRATSDPKIDKKRAPSIDFGSQNSPEFTSERLKIPKLVPKSSFLTEFFFNIFWHGFGLDFGVLSPGAYNSADTNAPEPCSPIYIYILELKARQGGPDN